MSKDFQKKGEPILNPQLIKIEHHRLAYTFSDPRLFLCIKIIEVLGLFKDKFAIIVD